MRYAIHIIHALIGDGNEVHGYTNIQRSIKVTIIHRSKLDDIEAQTDEINID